MEIKIQLKKIELTGEAIIWDKKDLGFKNFAGSVYFENTNYNGFLNHDGTVYVKRNGRFLGNLKPSNFIYA